MTRAFRVFGVALALAASSLQIAAAQTLKCRQIISEVEKSRSMRDPLALDVRAASGRIEIVVADTGNDAVNVFSATGHLKLKADKAADLRAPIGVVLQRNGEIVVAEMDSPILKILDVKGALAEKIDLSRLVTDAREKVNPGRMCLDDEDNLYVLDRGNQQVLVLDAQRRTCARHACGDEKEARMIQDIFVDSERAMIVASSKGTAIHSFDAKGWPLARFGEHGGRRDTFSFPAGVTVDQKDRLWVADGFQHTLKVFSRAGKFLFEVGGPGTGPGQFDFPVDLTFDARGLLYVLEKGGNRVQVLELEEAPAKK
ncbi:MAG: hypothetical protein HYY16_08680 [Planctomycetes bacterium]|nr:hypothetical protein [Planctomycetota bacterium]